MENHNLVLQYIKNCLDSLSYDQDMVSNLSIAKPSARYGCCESNSWTLSSILVFEVLMVPTNTIIQPTRLWTLSKFY